MQNNGWDMDRAVANFEQVKVRSVDSRLNVPQVLTLDYRLYCHGTPFCDV